VRGFGAVRNAPSISPFEVALVSAWADGGAPKGDDRPPDFDDGHHPPRPDLLLRLPSRSVPPAGERVTLETEAILSERDLMDGPVFRPGLWVRGWRFYPNDPAIVHAEITLPDGRLLGTWTPPDADVQLPDDVGVKLASGPATVTVSYRSARLQQDFPVAPPRLPPVLGLFTSRVRPAREIAHATTGCGTDEWNADADLLALRPIVDREGGGVAVALELPDRPPVPLVSVRDAMPEYQPTYWLRDRVSMTAGTRLLVESDTPGCQVVLTLARSVR
jgi:hypothetical protein